MKEGCRLGSSVVHNLRGASEQGNTQLSASSLTASRVTPAQQLEDYVKNHGGSRSIRRILIANNGMAATKAMLSMRQWAYTEFDDDKLLQFVVMATPEDLAANAEFVRLGDKIVEVPGGPNRNNYANVPLIVETAKREGVDAVWPGWGHASENPKLPQSLADNGIEFIGPTSPVMAALGDKIAANILAQTAGVNSIPWSGNGLTAQLDKGGHIPQETFDKACVTSADQAAAVANDIGYPVMIKASEGGGGKGIRMANNEDELRTGYQQVVNEVVGSPVFMMQLCTQARHIEVQIVGDKHGNAVALSGRDCSTQRRFQKIFEEGPPSIVKPETMRKMEKAAQRLTSSIGYQGAGTVEYLYNADKDDYYFLELNPRLQVEHPVTEGLTGVNLPATQLQVAMGIPLSRVPQVRSFYGRDPSGSDPIDFLNEDYAPINTHVIAARITAENPDEGFKPTSGAIERVEFQSTPEVWGYFSVGSKGAVHEFADSQFGHLFAKGPTREKARKALIMALKRTDVRGEIRTAVDYLQQLLNKEEFIDNTIDTSWLDGLIKQKAVAVPVRQEDSVIAAALFRAKKAVDARSQSLQDSLEKGQLILRDAQTMNTVPVEITFKDTKFTFEVTRVAPDLFRLVINGQTLEARVREQTDGSFLVEYGSRSSKVYGREEPLGLRMSIDGTTVFIPTVYDPSELRSDVTGKVVRYLQDDGSEVKAGEPFVEVEAMKMIMSLKAGESGRVTQTKSAGSVIQAGDLLATLQLKDPSRVKKIEPFTGQLNIEAGPIRLGDTDALRRLELVMDGYDHEPLSLVQRLTGEAGGDAEEIAQQIEGLLKRYLDVEEIFKDGPNDAVISSLIRENKSNLRKVLDLKVAHRQVDRRNQLVLSLLRLLSTFPDRFGTWVMPESLKDVLARLEALNVAGRAYGRLALQAGSLLRRAQTMPFQERVEALRQQLGAMEKGGKGAEMVAMNSRVQAGVDLLAVLFSDSNADIRNGAMEVYLRRVYRSSQILSMRFFEGPGGATVCAYTFRQKDLDASEAPVRVGVFVLVEDEAALESDFGSIVETLKKEVDASGDSQESSPLNVVHVAMLKPKKDDRDDGWEEYAQSMEKLVQSRTAELCAAKTRTVNLMIPQTPRATRYFSFLSKEDFTDSKLRRDMRPTFPPLLELERLSENYSISRLPAITQNRQVYVGTPKTPPTKKAKGLQSIFVREVCNTPAALSDLQTGVAFISNALDELERGFLDPQVQPTASSSIFINIIPPLDTVTEEGAAVELFEDLISHVRRELSARLLKLRVDQIEFKVRIPPEGYGEDKGNRVIRLSASSATGRWLDTDAVRELPDRITAEPRQFVALSGEGTTSVSPYPEFDKITMKRTAARNAGSTYVYDFLGLLEVSLSRTWSEFSQRVRNAQEEASVETSLVNPPTMPDESFQAYLLEEGSDGQLEIVEDWNAAANKIGMVAFLLRLKTPEYPEGREVVMIANDITVQGGSFGVAEDQFFQKASQFARERGLPRIYLACNSGARIGLYEDLKPKFKVAWKDASNPSLGYNYLYLTEEDAKGVPPGAIRGEMITDEGERRMRIDDIVGTESLSIGVENLQGSGLIAGETSRAYEETFTLSYVTGRSVGIGAYLVRLGQRTIQMQRGPLILTGFQALNKLLGREVYVSQDQLGGPQIMHSNGVSHEVVQDDQEGMRAVLDWLSYTPKTFFDAHSPPPDGLVTDPVDREVDVVPSSTPHDPRTWLGGVDMGEKGWQGGFFDRGTFKEYLSGWGKGVVVGRAKLGGIPVGCIAVETRTVEAKVPADPANPDSREAVWFPDSAFKTAQAIEDFNKGENLPLFIFANWRGFSGGTRDMFGEILKFGAMIVDALRKYRHPVFVYIPPNGELRGGAWVVIDPSINPEKMEMYADTEARGGILEPPGICEIKFRSQEQISLMHRLDPELLELDKELEECMTDSDALGLKEKIRKRERALIPLYTSIACGYADLHDKAGRMKAKGVIRDALEWKGARSKLYWRMRRRLAEDRIVSELVNAGGMSDAQARHAIANILPAATGSEDDKAVAGFLESEGGRGACTGLVEDSRRVHAKNQVRKIAQESGLSAADLNALLG
uniref:Uncharacterized protein n=1 Tax=Chromera velia CCMP2878 TaxID=1169474 RepID=A0A0K6S787_9ALVE|eukprot:Cvel_530.t1-p1 / transcript=Cvel_530.t1 / gene=Cvel_530 / organism=Chromera_velia_CCMP2878 / gene_product=Acetyl-CoA carboxylase 2, putative / transcript_product=Acetyl-CoA carboxylase 2, putative / location=Cvel_scaffold16:150853-171209(-) / protein_length=2092 / sequence_SO=supercontig / SO=protein_coding / is_pseudo=false